LPGSVGPAPLDRYVVDGVISSRTCLLPMVTPFSRECLRLFEHYRNNTLIRAGGLYDQPHRYIQAMSLLNAKVKT